MNNTFYLNKLPLWGRIVMSIGICRMGFIGATNKNIKSKTLKEESYGII